MAKLSKNERAAHNQALELLKKPVLTDEEKEFVFENWHEAANHMNGDAGAFFTPLDLAWDTTLGSVYIDSDFSVVDLCAGIGVLAYTIAKRKPNSKIVCVEINPDYVEIGKKLVPEAEWHCLDVMDMDELVKLGRFDYAVSNPPYGRVKTFKGKSPSLYSGGEAEYKVMEVAANMADSGWFLIQQQSAPFRYSGVQCYEEVVSRKLKTFLDATGIELSIDIGVDTTVYSGFKGVNIITEIVECDFNAYEGAPVILQEPEEQLNMFALAS